MSYGEKEQANRWRFSKEISFGDVMLAASIVVLVANLKFTVDDHEKRLTAAEGTLASHEEHLARHDTAIAVIETQLKNGK